VAYADDNEVNWCLQSMTKNGRDGRSPAFVEGGFDALFRRLLIYVQQWVAVESYADSFQQRNELNCRAHQGIIDLLEQ
jgi:hypothetical protein